MLIQIITSLLLASTAIAAVDGYSHLSDGKLRVHLNDSKAQSQGISDFIELMKLSGMKDKVMPVGSQNVTLYKSKNLAGVVLYSFVYTNEQGKVRQGASITMPISDTAFTSFSTTREFASVAGESAYALFKLLSVHGQKTLQNGLVTQYKMGKLLCNYNHRDAIHRCHLDFSS